MTNIDKKIEEFETKFQGWEDGMRVFAEKELSEKELFVLDMREKGHTLEEVGKKLVVTRERIRQIEAKANEKVRMKTYFKDWLKQALLDIQKETARDMVDFCYASQSQRLNQKEFHNYDPNEALNTVYKEITGEDYE